MKPVLKAEIVAACIMANGGAVSPFESRELERIIASRAANRERFLQKVRSPAWVWKKPAPRR
ncbi:MAG: hypothetical protein LBU96_14755 [Yokenella regensburgei]|jgi:hypothetical protein|nr:hypothetical protein [Yokenella regensburgei]